MQTTFSGVLNCVADRLFLAVGVLLAMTLVGCGDSTASQPQINQDALEQLDLASMNGYEVANALLTIVEWPGEELCGEEWEAGLFIEDDWDQNYPEASGLADGSEPTPEILQAVRDSGEDPALFEIWHVNAYRAIFLSLDDFTEETSVLAQVTQVLWLGFDPEGTPHWGADLGSALVRCQ